MAVLNIAPGGARTGPHTALKKGKSTGLKKKKKRNRKWVWRKATLEAGQVAVDVLASVGVVKLLCTRAFFNSMAFVR